MAPGTWVERWCQGPITLEEAMKLSQIVITKTEEPVDAPRGIVFKIAIFDNKECVDTFYVSTENEVFNLVSDYLEDLDY